MRPHSRPRPRPQHSGDEGATTTTSRRQRQQCDNATMKSRRPHLSSSVPPRAMTRPPLALVASSPTTSLRVHPPAGQRWHPRLTLTTSYVPPLAVMTAPRPCVSVVLTHLMRPSTRGDEGASPSSCPSMCDNSDDNAASPRPHRVLTHLLPPHTGRTTTAPRLIPPHTTTTMVPSSHPLPPHTSLHSRQ